MRSIDEWQERSRQARDQSLTPEQCWLSVVEQAGEVARAIRTNRIEMLGDGRLLAAPLASVIEFSDLVGFSLADAAWHKFPAICPYCISLAPGFESIADRVLEGSPVGRGTGKTG